MADNGVTHKELNKALGAQTARIIATINRSEDVAREDLKEVSDRVTYIERRGWAETAVASILTFFGIILYGKYTGGS
jgi:hypothetical protein